MKFKSLIYCAAVVSLGLASCSDDMNYKEFRIQDEDFVKRNFGDVGKIVTHLYRTLDYDLGQMYGGASLCSATDEAVYSHRGESIESYFNGSWSPVVPNSNTWSTCWDAISYCNLFLDDFNNLTFPDHTQEKSYKDFLAWYNNLQFEVRFIRAYSYFRLVREYGGVPLITAHLDYEEANNVPRSTADAIFDFIDSECEAIRDTICSDYSSAYPEVGYEQGRVNNLGVYALRARAALYRASKLFAKDKDEMTQKQLWHDAALRAQECIEACKKNGMRLANNYASLFGTDNWKNTESTKEIIFARRIDDSGTRNLAYEKRNFPVGMSGGAGGNCPTENLVSAYEMTNGRSIDDPASGYDDQNPYKNRDARLSATVAVNGEKWPQQLPQDALETFYGGLNSRSVSYGTPTGYYLKKYLDAAAKISGTGQTANTHTWILFRLGGVYLDYAEAMLNYTGSGYQTADGLTMTAAEAINMVRTRVKQPNLPTGLSYDDFTKRYENERFVELAFEGHRMYDVRRWMKAPQYFLDIKVMEITKNADETLTFTPVLNPTYITKRRWAGDHMYFWPIPQSEILKAGALVQNPGW